MSETIRTGVVTRCKRLNVRTNPSATAPIKTVIERGSIVTVDLDDSNDKFYRISANRKLVRPVTDENIEGYCMRDYISIVADQYTKEELGVKG